MSPRPTAPLPISCPKYEPVEGTRRCRQYHADGACALPDEFMCVEWLKANGHASAPSAPAPPPLERDLFGAPMPPPLDASSPSRASAPSAPPTKLAARVPAVHTADLASFQALGTEVRLDSTDLGELWLVPAYTGADRQELTFDHAALLATLCHALPSARITALVRKQRARSA